MASRQLQSNSRGRDDAEASYPFRVVCILYTSKSKDLLDVVSDDNRGAYDRSEALVRAHKIRKLPTRLRVRLYTTTSSQHFLQLLKGKRRCTEIDVRAVTLLIIGMGPGHRRGKV